MPPGSCEGGAAAAVGALAIEASSTVTAVVADPPAPPWILPQDDRFVALRCLHSGIVAQTRADPRWRLALPLASPRHQLPRSMFADRFRLSGQAHQGRRPSALVPLGGEARRL